MKLDCGCEVDEVNVMYFLNLWDERTMCEGCGVDYIAIGDDPRAELIDVYMGLCGHETDEDNALCGDCEAV